jgi:hypothetical protein
MKLKRTMQRTEARLREAKASAVDASAAVTRKRKAAREAEEDFYSGVRLARFCYGVPCASATKPAAAKLTSTTKVHDYP